MKSKIIIIMSSIILLLIICGILIMKEYNPSTKGQPVATCFNPKTGQEIDTSNCSSRSEPGHTITDPNYKDY